MFSHRHIALCLLTATALAVAVPCFCKAGEVLRRFPVELAILAGDARLLNDVSITATRRHGLQTRIASSLSTLRLLARQYADEKGRRTVGGLLTSVDTLRNEFEAARYASFAAGAARLAGEYPLDLSRVGPDAARPQDVAAGKRIYRDLCQGCHEYADRSRSNPAENLFTLGRELPEREFVARLIGGVHGTPAVALRNPLTDAEIAGLAAYLTHRSP